MRARRMAETRRAPAGAGRFAPPEAFAFGPCGRLRAPRAGGVARIALCLVLCGGLPAAAHAQPRPGAGSRRLNLPLLRTEVPAAVEVTADSLEYDPGTGWAVARGNVIVRRGEERLYADEARIHMESGQVEAAGNVELDRGEAGTWRGDTLRYDFRSRRGTTTGNRIHAPPFFIRADQMDTADDGRIELQRTVMSTCTNAPGHEHYALFVRQATLRPEHSIVGRGATLKLFGIPLLYTPYLYRGLEHGEGWRVDPGYSSRMGGFLLGTYRRRIFDVGHDGFVRSRTRIDYRTRRGPAGGQGFEWELGPDARGSASFYALHDLDPDDDDRPEGRVAPFRHRLSLRHAWAISPADQVRVRADRLSDPYWLRDFDEDAYRRYRQPDNHLSYTRSHPDYSLGILARLRLNEFYEQVEKLPEVWFDTLRRETVVDNLYYESRNRLAFLRRQFEAASGRDAQDAWRLDSRHRVFYPFKTAGFLSLVPRAGARLTAYSKTRELRHEWVPAESPAPAGNGDETDGDSEPDPQGTYRTVTEEGGSAQRWMMELGMEASFRAYRVFDLNGQPWRHVVEPFANYTLVPQPNLTPDRLFQFDAVDALDEEHGLDLGMRHLLQTRGHDRRVRTVADATVATTAAFARESGRDLVDRVRFDARWRPIDAFALDTRGHFSLTDSALQALDSRLSLQHAPVWMFGLEHVYRRERNSLVAGDMTFAPNRDWTLGVFGRYDYETGHSEEQGGFLQYSLDCIAFRLGGIFRPGYTRSDGSRRDDDFRVIFNLWLTAFPPDNLNQRYRQ